MSRTNPVKGFSVTATPWDITIARGGSKVVLAPAETATLKNLLATALAIPRPTRLPYVQVNDFRILFDNDGADLTLVRKGQKEALAFSVNQIDNLVEALEVAVQMHISEQVHRTEPRPGAARAALVTPDPLIDGRE